MAEDTSPEAVVAEAVRRYRVARGLSNGELAARAGISQAMLSKIEHARTSCSLTTLARLATALVVPVADLPHGDEPGPAAVHTPAGTGARALGASPHAGHSDLLLGAPRGSPGRLEAHVVTLAGGGRRARAPPPRRQRAALRPRGRDGLRATGGSRCTLRPGDALQLDGTGEHGPHELLEAPVRFLSVVATT